MEATDSIPTFLIFAFQGCYAPGLLADPWSSQEAVQEVRPVTIPFMLMLVAAATMLLAALTWWREMSKSIPVTLIGIAFACVVGFLAYQANDVYQNTPSFETFVSGGNYYIGVGEFCFYLLGVFMMILVSLIFVAREIGWETERNLLFLATGSTVVMAVFWSLFSVAVWNCV